jgi:hypothetical protein
MTIGDPDAELNLSASGTVALLGRAPDWETSQDFDADLGADFDGMVEEISEQAAEQLELQMEMLERHLDAQLENLSATLGASGLKMEETEKIARRAREASIRATARAQEKMQRAQEKMRRKLDAAQRKAEARAARAERKTERRFQERRGWNFETGPARPEPPSDPVTEEERMMILRLLQEKKISAEEADKLLSALEG